MPIWCLQRLLAGLAAVPLAVVLDYSVLTAASQATLLVDSWSGELDAIFLWPLVEKVLFDEEVVSACFLEYHLVSSDVIFDRRYPCLIVR